MTIVIWLKICIIGLPLLGALTGRWVRERHPLATDRLAAIIFGVAGLGGMALFLINGYDRCILATGRQNCLFDGLASLSLLGLGLGLASHSLMSRSRNHTLGLLLTGAWAGLGLAENLFVFLLALNLLLYVIYRWLDDRDLKWRIMVLRDDYKENKKHKP